MGAANQQALRALEPLDDAWEHYSWTIRGWREIGDHVVLEVEVRGTVARAALK